MDIGNFQEKLNSYTESMRKTHTSFKNHPTEDRGASMLIKRVEYNGLTSISNPTWFPHVIDAECKASGSVMAPTKGVGT